MTLTLNASCRCGAVRFSCESHAPVPFMRCYCSICRKTQGGGGYAINLSARAETLTVEGEEAIGVFHAEIADEAGHCEVSSGERRFCTKCGTALWVFDPSWSELIHPFASVIDTELPVPPSSVHIMLDFKPDWVAVEAGPEDAVFDRYPQQSLEDWHKERGLWVE
ncbi:GFA family protein [Pseudoroseicyclus aestuarii]|uniref:CENP-V/GFA domain-containing protein n=1 Tax=Pseudoroseicyclus aestuarii TaxID=1795041 RepID=A0A318SVH1_9RHOB|nr:GFA family protein [Pseudoroseicyclus aestuarii]PYE85492.1 hypothetical protein DFP88_101159 [Pseudoroseicyclus aestuarii]